MGRRHRRKGAGRCVTIGLAFDWDAMIAAGFRARQMRAAKQKSV